MFLDVSLMFLSRFQDQLRVMGPAGFVVWRSTYFSSLQLDSAWHTWHMWTMRSSQHVLTLYVLKCHQRSKCVY